MVDQKGQSMAVYVLSITHKHGTNVYAFSSYEKAYQGLSQYVEAWWGNYADSDMPSGAEEKINQYFDESMAYDEWWSIDECIVDCRTF